MKSQIKSFLSIILVAVIGIAGISNYYFFEDEIETNRSEISNSDLISGFDQALQFSSAKINVPVFKALDTVCDFISKAARIGFDIAEFGSLKAIWPEKTQCFYSVYTLLYPFHYFW
jgi:hypothetical protein